MIPSTYLIDRNYLMKNKLLLFYNMDSVINLTIKKEKKRVFIFQFDIGKSSVCRPIIM